MKKQKQNRLVVGSLAWADTIPEWLLNEVKAERMLLGLGSIINPEIEKVGDAETIVYLMTASLRQPLSREHTEIYVYLTAKLMKKRDKEVTEEIMNKKLEQGLTDYETQELKKLKQMLYEKRGGDIDNPLLNMLRSFK